MLEEGGDEKMQVTADWAEGAVERRGGVNWEVIRRDPDTFRAGKEPAEREVNEQSRPFQFITQFDNICQ